MAWSILIDLWANQRLRLEIPQWLVLMRKRLLSEIYLLLNVNSIGLLLQVQHRWECIWLIIYESLKLRHSNNSIKVHLFGEDESKNIRPSHSTHVTGKSLRPSLSRQSRLAETDHLRIRDKRTEHLIKPKSGDRTAVHWTDGSFKLVVYTSLLRTWPNPRIYPKHEDVIIGFDFNQNWTVLSDNFRIKLYVHQITFVNGAV